MKFGLRYCNAGRYVYPANAIELVQAGEAAGFESAWTVDHVVVPEGYKSAYPYSDDGKMAGGKNDMAIPDPLIWMAYVAAGTSKINLATGILIVPQRNPVVAAKQIATLDLMSGGRVLLGIGVGWLEEEFNAIGVPFGDRGRRTDDYIYAMQELWATDHSTYESEFTKFTAVNSQPKPVNRTIPIIVGGHSKAAARRAGRLGDGFFPARGASSELIDLARRTAEEHGRDPDAIEITASLPEDLDTIPELAACGVTRLLVPVLPMFGVAGIINNIDEVAPWADTIDKYRDL